MIAVRKNAGHFLCEPDMAYMRMRAQLQLKQVTIAELFWCNDEDMPLAQNYSIYVGKQRQPKGYSVILERTYIYRYRIEIK